MQKVLATVLFVTWWVTAFGPTFHEEPMVPHYGTKVVVFACVRGMVLTIEPMINTGTWEIDTDMKTGWAYKTLDGGLSCQ